LAASTTIEMTLSLILMYIQYRIPGSCPRFERGDSAERTGQDRIVSSETEFCEERDSPGEEASGVTPARLLILFSAGQKRDLRESARREGAFPPAKSERTHQRLR